MRGVVVVLIAFLLSCVCGGVSAQTLQTVRVVGPSNDGIKAIYYGIQSGIFRKHGLNVEVSPAANGGAATTALTGGAADVAFVGIATPIFAHVRGVPMQIIAPVSIYRSKEPHNAALVLRDSPIHRGRDLDGKVFGTVTIGDQLTASMLAWIDRTGGDSKSVKPVEIPPSAALDALESGRIAAVIVNEPFVSRLLASGKTRVLTHPQDMIAKTFESGAYVVMAPAVAQNPELYRRFADALHEAQEYTNSHLPETVDLVASYTHLPAEVVSSSVRIVDGDFVEAKNIQPVIDILVKYGMIDKPFPAQELISSAAVEHR